MTAWHLIISWPSTSWHFFWVLTAMYGLGFLAPLRSREATATDATDEDAPLPLGVRVSLAFALAASVVAFIGAAAVFVRGPGLFGPETFPLPWFPHGPIEPLVLAVQLDRLGAFFMLIISGFAALVCVYSYAALKANHFRGYGHWICAAFNAFVWSTLLVVLAADCLSLIIALELMSVSFGYLALYKHLWFEGGGKPESERHERHDARLAPQVYWMASHTSTAFLLVAITILGLNAGSLEFSEIASHADSLDPALASLCFLLALAGLGIRAGLVPAHVWVPLVHPQSPTPTHAFSLGIAIKVGVYLMIRFFFQFMEPQTWWGYTLLLTAALTALVNVWYAIASHDLKAALAYHSIENVGIMTAGLGLGLIFFAQDGPNVPWIAGLALVAGLYHLLNHAVFKGLLYMATGAIHNLTGTVEIARLGGLIKLYPWTSACFIIGALAISGFPPLNGFVSEWLTLQVLFLGLSKTTPVGIAVLIGALILLAASFALTAFCFYKLVGLVFLGQPRLSKREREKEGWKTADAPLPMRAAMAVMALLCLLLGVLPGLVAPWLAGTVTSLSPRLAVDRPFSGLFDAPHLLGLELTKIEGVAHFAVNYGVVWLVLVATALALAAWFFVRHAQVRRPFRPWNCGTRFDPIAMQYTGAAVSELVRRVRQEEPTPHRETLRMRGGAPGAGSQPPGEKEKTEAGRSRGIQLNEWLRMTENKNHPQWVREVFRSGYNRFSKWLYGTSERIGLALQNGDIRRYLGYILLTQLAVMVLFLIIGTGEAAHG